VSPDGKSIAAVLTDHRTVKVWRLEGGEPEPVPGLPHTAILIGWTDDSKGLVVSDMDRQLLRVDVKTGKHTPVNTIGLPDLAGLKSLYISSALEDGRYYAYAYRKELTTLFLVTGMR
jgi:hypothetical protein